MHLQFTENILGGLPNSEEIFSQFIGSKSPNAPNIEDEVEAVGVDTVVEKGTTVFARTKDGRPFIYDYVIKGFFKEACGALQRLSEKSEGTKSKKPVNESGKISSYKKIIDQLIFIQPRKIILYNPDGTIGRCQRPLRAETPLGPRVSLASSEEIPAGSSINFRIVSFSEGYIPAIKEWLDYGFWKGLGQWRNSGKGKFIWKEIPPFNIVELNPVMSNENIPEPVPITELTNTPLPKFVNENMPPYPVEIEERPKKRAKSKKADLEEMSSEIAESEEPESPAIPDVTPPKRTRKRKESILAEEGI